MTANLTNRQYNGRYALIHAFYWMALCAGAGFASVMMLDAGYTNTEIGVTIAVSNVLSFILQPLVANIADRNKRVSLHKLLLLFAGITVLCLCGLYLYPQKSLLYIALMVIIQAAFSVLQPIINSLCSLYAQSGVYLNYGAARGCGSFTYSICSLSMGTLVMYYGVGMLQLSAILLLFAFVACVLSFKLPVGRLARPFGRTPDPDEPASGETVPDDGEAVGLWTFIKRNRWFTLFICAAVLMLIENSFIGTYSIQIISSIGGNEASMGTAVAITAISELPSMFSFNKLNRRFGARKLLRVSALFFGVKYVLVFLATSVTGYYLLQITQMLGYALFVPASVSFAGEVLSRHDAVKGQAFCTAAFTLANVLACLLGGWLLDAGGVHSTLLTGTLVSVVGVILTFIIIGRVPLREGVKKQGAQG